MISKLRLVEMELFSYCNRKCLWCPNRGVDRLEYYGMEREIFYGVLEELKRGEYDGAITFSRYNEPMSQIDVFKDKLRLIREMLPNKLITNTNGDFLSKENLEGLLIDELTIMDYDGKGTVACAQRLADCGVSLDRIDKNYVYGTFNQMKILYYVNWQDNRVITDRGGVLSEYSDKVRTHECFEPTYFVGINYDGTVSPCCNIRNDIKKLKPFIIGDLHKNSLSEILATQQANNFRNKCANAIFDENSPCYTCDNRGGRYTRGNGGIWYE